MSTLDGWPALGLGTWCIGEHAGSRRAEVAAVRHALELGYRVIDTAEMYGDGGSEEVIGEALDGALREGVCSRDDVRLVSKVLPSNASTAGVVAACDRSRRRLRVDRIDLYLLHWPGPHPLAQTLAGFERLQAAASIGHWGVSNFDAAAMRKLVSLRGGDACAANQVYYSLGQRGVEFDLLPWQRDHSMPLMAYCPIDRGVLAGDGGLATLAAPLGLTAAQLALAWTLRGRGVIALPKAVQRRHLEDNLKAARVTLDAATLAGLDRLFPPPAGAQPLAIV